MQGPVEVLGETYDGQMPGWRQLSDAEIAAVLTFIRGSWGNSAAPVSTELVAEVRANESRVQPWTADELSQIAANLPAIEAEEGDTTEESPPPEDGEPPPPAGEGAIP
jgi:hypothetical protein